jgi:hypothetical protein
MDSMRETLASMILEDDDMFEFTLWSLGVGIRKINSFETLEPEMRDMFLRIVDKLGEAGIH